MRPLDEMIVAMFAVLAMVLLTWLAFALSTLFEGFPRLRINQVLGIIAVTAFSMAIAVAMGPDGGIVVVFFIPVAAILIGFAGMWNKEFRLLMSRRADEFPGPSDKLAWIFVLTVMAPAGVWLFRSYRRVQWPEPAKEARTHPLDEHDLSVEVSEMSRIGA
jgi:hypothetical protein